MSITVVGSVAFDSIQTPFGSVDRAIGGAATYFSVAASYFTRVQLVATVGEDFGDEEMKVFENRSIDTSGLVRVKGGKSFFWQGEYGFDMNVAQTKDTQLNVFADFKPVLPEAFRKPRVLFLANIDPVLQLDVLEQCERPELIALDTMNYWISSKKEDLEKVVRRCDLLIINEGEVRQFTNEPNVVKGGRAILALGPKTLVIKRGEYGVVMLRKDRVFAIPAYPLETVFDPTGAGDTFAGGLLGSFAASKEMNESDLRRSIIYGSVLASFNVESFSLHRLKSLSRSEIEQRYREFRELTHFDDLTS
jgi:sugar/nucleoside kinase (ribokinase family)